jgi:uncharacterized protein (TIGR01244 family)
VAVVKRNVVAGLFQSLSSVLWLLWSALVLAEGEVVTEMFADLSTVVEIGEVRPVDGMTSAGVPNPESLKVFANNGYVAVIDLRGEDEKDGSTESDAAFELGMSYVALPVEGAAAINFENARKLDTLINDFSGPVLVHCGSGNRVGALVAVQKSLEGADDDMAIAIGQSAGLASLEGVVRERLADKRRD